MTDELKSQILTLIQSTPELAEMASKGNSSGLSAGVPDYLPKIPKPNTFVGERGIYALLGIEDGEAFLQTVEGLAVSDTPLAPAFKRVERWLKDGVGIDVGSVIVQQTLQSLTLSNGGPFNDASIATLIDFGQQKQQISVSEISSILAEV